MHDLTFFFDLYITLRAYAIVLYVSPPYRLMLPCIQVMEQLIRLALLQPPRRSEQVTLKVGALLACLAVAAKA